MSDKEIYELFIEIKRLGLYRVKEFDSLTVDEFAEIYNGYGPDSWPEALRNAITIIYRNFKPLAGVHDIGYHFKDRTERGWRLTQWRWKENGKILLNDRYPVRKWWLLPLRWYAEKKINLAYDLLYRFSKDVYMS